MPKDNGSADRLRERMAASRVVIHWFGVNRALSSEQKEKAAQAFGAEGAFLSAGKRLFDTGDTAYRQLTSVKTEITSYWHGITLPFPDPGLRLIRREDVDGFAATMRDYQRKLAEGVSELDKAYSKLKDSAKAKLGELFDSKDYPTNLDNLFRIDFDFPNVEPPDYLKRLSPQIYMEEEAKVSRRFEEAVHLAEQAFINEFYRLVSHLADRLVPGEHGDKKIFRDSAVENMQTFFGRFYVFNVSTNNQLDDLVSQTQKLVTGLTADALRNDDELRQNVAACLVQIRNSLDNLVCTQTLIHKEKQS